MVRDGYFYGAGCLLAAVIIAWLAAWPYAVPVFLLGAFFLWFFRDPERQIPRIPGAVVSPGDGRVTDVSVVSAGGTPRNRISIFLSVFDVHVNRSPIGGVIRDVRYQRGKFLNAMQANSAEENEQNIVTVEGQIEGQVRTVIFKQIAGLIARRIVSFVREGVAIGAGERFGMIRFGSRLDVYLPDGVRPLVAEGQTAIAGETVLADLRAPDSGRTFRVG